MEKKDNRTLNPQDQYELRLQVITLRQRGISRKEVARITGVSQTHVSTIWQRYLKGGISAIQSILRGRRHGQQRILSSEQKTTIQQLMADYTPDSLYLPFTRWSRDAIRLLILQKWGIDLPLRTISDYLKRWKITSGESD